MSTLTPSQEDLALLTAQYHKALEGLYEAYAFGAMLLRLKIHLENAPEAQVDQVSSQPIENSNNHRAVSHVRTPGEKGIIQTHGGAILGGGWNAGLGLKGWLAEHCPEIHYKTAMRFLSLAEATQRALAPMPGEDDEDAEGTPTPWQPSEESVRAYLAGKSQRQVLRLGGRREGAGAPKKRWSEALGKSPEVAWKKIEEALEPLNALIVGEGLSCLLGVNERTTLRNALRLLLAKLDEEGNVRP